MSLPNNRKLWTGVAFAAVTVALGSAYAQQGPRGKSSYAPVEITEPFSAILARLSAQKPSVEREHMAVLNERYDLSNRPAAGVTMDRTKPVQEGVRVKLTAGTTWDSLAGMTPEQIRDRNLFPPGFLPLPHPKHVEGGMVFPRFLINEIKRQEARDLTRFDVDFDIPDHFLPEFPPAIYLNQRSDLGDVSQSQLVTVENYYQLFNGIINPKQLEGLRLLVTPFPQQQFNQTEDRRSEQPSRGGDALFPARRQAGHRSGGRSRRPIEPTGRAHTAPRCARRPTTTTPSRSDHRGRRRAPCPPSACRPRFAIGRRC